MCSTYYSAEQNFYYMFLQLNFLKVLLSRFHSVASNFPDGLSDAKEGQDTDTATPRLSWLPGLASSITSHNPLTHHNLP